MNRPFMSISHRLPPRDLPIAACRSRLSRDLQCFRKRLILNNLVNAECDAICFAKRISPCSATTIRHRAPSLLEALKRRGACNPSSTVGASFFTSAHCTEQRVKSRARVSPRVRVIVAPSARSRHGKDIVKRAAKARRSRRNFFPPRDDFLRPMDTRERLSVRFELFIDVRRRFGGAYDPVFKRSTAWPSIDERVRMARRQGVVRRAGTYAAGDRPPCR